MDRNFESLSIYLNRYQKAPFECSNCGSRWLSVVIIAHMRDDIIENLAVDNTDASVKCDSCEKYGTLADFGQYDFDAEEK